jgi:hypothetical protein
VFKVTCYWENVPDRQQHLVKQLVQFRSCVNSSLRWCPVFAT